VKRKFTGPGKCVSLSKNSTQSGTNCILYTAIKLYHYYRKLTVNTPRYAMTPDEMRTSPTILLMRLSKVTIDSSQRPFSSPRPPINYKIKCVSINRKRMHYYMDVLHQMTRNNLCDHKLMRIESLDFKNCVVINANQQNSNIQMVFIIHTVFNCYKKLFSYTLLIKRGIFF